MRSFLLVTLGILWSSVASSQEPIPVNRVFEGELFGRQMSVLRDASEKLTIEDIQTPANQQLFESLDSDTPKFAYTNDQVWLRFQLSNSAEQAVELMVESRYTLLDYLTLYHPDGQGGFVLQELGDHRPYENRMVKDRLSVFVIKAPPGISTYYIQVSTKGSMLLPIEFWSPPEFHTNSRWEYQIIGLVLGFLGVMMLYNIFLAVSFPKDRWAYIFYVGFILSISYYLLGVFGVGMELFASDSNVNFVQNMGLLAAVGLSNLFSLLFAVLFLDMKERMPRSYVLFRGFIVINILVLLGCFSNNYNLMAKLINVFALITSLCLIANGIYNVIKGYRPAFYYTVAWVSFLMGTVSFALFVGGVMPFNFFTTWGQSIGAAADVVLLSLALGDRVNYVREMHENKIKSLNEDLQHHIVNIEKIVDEKTRDIKSIMRHIQQGIFTINNPPEGSDAVGVVGSDFSAHLTQIVGEADFTGHDVMKLIFHKTDLSNDARSRIHSVLNSSLGEDEINFVMNSCNLPPEFRMHDEGGAEHIFEIDWNAVVNENTGDIDKILVTLRDVTKLRALQAEAKLQQEELSYIAEILNVEAEKFNKFIDNSYSYIEESRRLIVNGPDERNNEVLKILFINMHTMKGISRSYNLHNLTNVLHDVEQHYAALQRDSEMKWQKEKLESDIQKVSDLFDKYNEINIEKLNRGTEKNRISLEKSFLWQKIGLLSKLDASMLSAPDQAILSETREAFSAIFMEATEKVFSEIFSIVDTLARDLGKDKPHINIDNPGFSFTEDGLDILQHVFIHVIRNSIDHGLETANDRINLSKPPEGNINIGLQKKDEFLEIRYADDGAGLNLKKLKQMGLDESLLPSDRVDDPSAIAALIFEDGISTAVELSDISGRGVGMGAIRRFIEDAGGRLELYFVDESKVTSSSETVPFGISMSLPEKFYDCDLKKAA